MGFNLAFKGLTFSLSETDNFVHRSFAKYNNVYSLLFSYCKCQSKFVTFATFGIALLFDPNEVIDSFTIFIVAPYIL